MMILDLSRRWVTAASARLSKTQDHLAESAPLCACA